ncbi:MAG TPA: hypothetical protein VNX67_07920, partial [Solirubrobacteraceae bacterium]|nr:hypothetical protein [Solirubrobacteraceae bacterium]
MASATAKQRSIRRALGVTALALCAGCSALSGPAPSIAAPGGSGGVGGAVAPAGGGTPPGSPQPARKVAVHGGSPTKGKAEVRAKPATGVNLTSAVCVPAIHCSTNPHQVSLGGELLIKGAGLRRGMVVAFPHSWNARIARNSPTARLASATAGMVVRVPGGAHSGRIMLLLGHGRHSNSYGPIHIVRYALGPPRPRTPHVSPPPPGAAPSGTAFDGQGMWIWYVSQSDGGDLPSIVAQAHAAGVTTLYVKSSDGSSNYWSQFSPELVQQLHANGLKVCAWQYVYGTSPAGEAGLGARAAATGADCLVIDAESEYEGKYGAAQTYIADLRAKIGA